MRQYPTFNWAIAWIFTVIVVFAVMQDSGMRGLTGNMVGVSGMAVKDYKNQIKSAYEKYPKLKQYPGIIEQIIQIESGGDSKATGDNGHALGIMQINKGDAGIYGYSENELKEDNQNKNIDAGAQKIRNIINNKNFVGGETGRKQIIYGYNQKNVPSESAVKSNKQSQIYPNYKGNLNLVNSRYNKMNAAEVLFNWDISSCFLPSTQITLDNGQTKQIQDISQGDKVLSYDLLNNKPVVAEVLNVFSHKENEYLIVNDKIKVTPYHHVYAKRENG